MVYGSLSSTWPVHSGVLIHRGTAFAAAGITWRNGTAVVALDAKTGVLKWENLTCGEERKISAQGGLMAAGDEILVSGGLGASVAAFDAKTGKVNKLLARGVRGCELGRLSDQALVFGGRLLFSPQDTQHASGKSDSIRLLNLSDPKKAAPLGRRSGVFPVWDDEVLVYAETGLTGLVASPRKTVAGQTELTKLWEPIKDNVLAVAIAGEHVVTVTQSRTGKNPVTTLAARAKLDGKVSWQVRLDRQARLDGLAITRSGEITVAFQDGSIELFGL